MAGAPNQPQRATAQEWLDGMREARRAERAPEAVRERLLERARELGQSSEGQGTWPLRAVEKRADRERWSLPIGIVPLLERPLLERPLLERPLLERPLLERPLFESWLGEQGGALTHPLLARIAGAALMIGLVVLVIADTRDGARGIASSANERAAGTPQSKASKASSVSSGAELPAATEAAAASDPTSEPRSLAGPAAADLRPSRAAHSEGETRRALVARALAGEHPRPADWGGAPRTPNEVRATLVGAAQQLGGGASQANAPLPSGPTPALPLSPDPDVPWLSPRAALQALRSVATPFLRDDSNYPRGTRVVARGNVRPETLRRERTRNFITNGDFSRGDVMWSVRSWQGYGDASVAAYYSVQAGALCTALERNQQVMGGWPWDDRRLTPSSFELERGKRYRLSLRAWSSGPEIVELVVKVGHQKEPYTPSLVAKVPLQAEPGLFDIDFVAARRDTFAGFAFVATSPHDQPHSEFCIDDVSVRPIDGDQ
jgi:hypothetical protein